MHEKQALGGKLLTKPFWFLLGLAMIAGLLLIKRFLFGIGASPIFQMDIPGVSGLYMMFSLERLLVAVDIPSPYWYTSLIKVNITHW